MANTSSSLLTLYLLFLTALMFTSTLLAAASSAHDLGLVPTASGRCQGLVGECLGSEEFDMDTEINRRILATTKYISYGALQRDTTPCSLRGASYYNCQPGAEANPYNRGCSAITRCRS